MMGRARFLAESQCAALQSLGAPRIFCASSILICGFLVYFLVDWLVEQSGRAFHRTMVCLP
jgi:hypothetical protein